jgi:hypothetical protein
MEESEAAKTAGASKPTLDVPGHTESGEWPLQRRSQASSVGRPGTSGTEHGGYKTMPTVRDPQSDAEREEALRVRDSEQVEHERDAAENDKAKKEKGGGCGCCLVM